MVVIGSGHMCGSAVGGERVVVFMGARAVAAGTAVAGHGLRDAVSM